MSVPASMQAEEGDPFMDAMTFHYLLSTHATEATTVGECVKSIKHHGGKVATSYDASAVTHVVLQTTAATDNNNGNGGAVQADPRLTLAFYA